MLNIIPKTQREEKIGSERKLIESL